MLTCTRRCLRPSVAESKKTWCEGAQCLSHTLEPGKSLHRPLHSCVPTHWHICSYYRPPFPMDKVGRPHLTRSTTRGGASPRWHGVYLCTKECGPPSRFTLKPFSPSFLLYYYAAQTGMSQNPLSPSAVVTYWSTIQSTNENINRACLPYHFIALRFITDMKQMPFKRSNWLKKIIKIDKIDLQFLSAL